MRRFERRFLGLIRSPTSQAVGLALAYIVIALIISLIRHWYYHSWTLDLGAFAQSLDSTLHGDILYNTPCGMSQLGYHFQPIMFFLVPIYWLAPHSETLLVVQSIALGASGYLVYRLARIQRLEHKTALLVEVAFLLSPLVHGVNFFDFHPEVLAIPTVLIMLIGLVQRKWVIFAIGLVLSLMTKEDVIMALGVFGAVMLLFQYLKIRKIQKRYLVIFSSSVIAFIIAIVVAKLSAGTQATPMLEYGELRYSYIDEPLGQLVVEALRAFFSWGSLFLFLAYFLPLGFLPLLSPLWAAPAFFILVMNMFATSDAQKTLHQYPAAAIPFLFIALIMALRQGRGVKIYSILKKLGKFLPATIVGILLLINLLLSLHPSSVFWDVRLPGAHEKAIDQVISLIPDGVTVTAPNHIFSHLCTRTITYSPYEPTKPNVSTGEFGLLDVDTDYVIIDLHWMRDYEDGYREENIDWASYIEGKYGLYASIDGVSLLKRDWSGPPVVTETESNANSGLNAIIYSDKDFHNKVLETQFFPPIRTDFPGVSVIPGIVPEDEWSIYLSGYIYVPKDEEHEFCLDSDGNVLLLIDNQYALYGNDFYPYPDRWMLTPSISTLDLAHIPFISRFVAFDRGCIKLDLDSGFHKIELYYTKHYETGHLNVDLGNVQVYRFLPEGASLANSQLVVGEGWAEAEIRIVSDGVERTLVTRYPVQQGSIHLDYAELAPLLSLPLDGFNIDITAELVLDEDSLIRFKSYTNDRIVIKFDGEIVADTAVLPTEGEVRLSAGRHTAQILYEGSIGEGLLHVEWFVVAY